MSSINEAVKENWIAIVVNGSQASFADLMIFFPWGWVSLQVKRYQRPDLEWAPTVRQRGVELHMVAQPCGDEFPPNQKACSGRHIGGYFGQWESAENGGSCQFTMDKTTQPWTKLAASQGDGYFATFVTSLGDRSAEVILQCDRAAGPHLKQVAPVQVIRAFV